VDYEANTGIGGSDVCVIYETHCSVDVQGIDNHQMADIPIATVGGVINTQCGEVIAILYPYAYTGTALQSILQPSLNCTIMMSMTNPSSLVASNGYVIPLNIVQGLPQMAIHPSPTKKGRFAHAILTSELDWDPGQWDVALNDDEQWFDAISNFECTPS